MSMRWFTRHKILRHHCESIKNMQMTMDHKKHAKIKLLNVLSRALICALCLLQDARGQALETSSGPVPRWHWGMPRSGGADLMAVAHGDGIWVAVGEAGTILSSKDAITWTRQPPHVAETLSEVVWKQDCFVALGRDSILTSADGIKWSKSGRNMMMLAASPARFLVFSRDGHAEWSEDGASWHKVTRPKGTSYSYLVWNGSSFAAGIDNVEWLSVDGESWKTNGKSTPVIAMKAKIGLPPEFRLRFNADSLAAKVKETLKYYNWYLTAASQSRIIAITEYGSIFSSTDGASWQDHPTSHPHKLKAVRWADEKFVAVGQRGMIAVSSDGINWRLVSDYGGGSRWAASSGTCTVFAADSSAVVVRSDKTASFSLPCGILHGNISAFGHTSHGFVFHAGTGVSPSIIGLSKDGMNWTYTRLPPRRSLPAFISAAGKRVAAVASDGGVLLSDDGVAWRSASQKAPWGLSCAAAHGGRIIAAGSRGLDAFVSLSTDGETWDVIQMNQEMRITAIASSGTACVLVGEQGVVMTTNDFRTWNRYDLPDKPRLSAVAWSAGQFMVAGSSGTVLLSEDGRSWRRTRAPGGVSLNSLSSRPGGGFLAADAILRILMTKDGASWEVLDSPESRVEGPPLVSCAWNGKTFMAVGDAQVVSSADGRHWQPQYVANMPQFSDVCWGRDTWVATSVKNGFYFSPDGVNWERSETAPPSEMLRTVVWTGRCFLAGGNAGLLYSSPDGRTWQRLPAPVSEAIYDLASDGKTILGLSSGGVTLRCEDTTGVQWQVVPTGLHTSLLRLCCTNGGHLAVGQDRRLYSCKDGQTWVQEAQNGTARAVATGGGCTALAGSFGVVALSSDMKTWSEQQMDDGLLLMDVCFGGGRFVAVGLHGNIVYSDLVTPRTVEK